MKYEIEIDLPTDVAAKWVPVAYRQAKPGESFFAPASFQAVFAKCGTGGEHIIIVPRVEWPAWCSADWIVKDAYGGLWAGSANPPRWDEKACDWRDFSSVDKFAAIPRLCHANLYAAFEHVPPRLSLIENHNRTKA